jgi:hypothetical protein
MTQKKCPNCQNDNDLFNPKCVVCQLSFDSIPNFKETTKAFSLLYGEVTKVMTAYGIGLAAQEKQWLVYLIEAFWKNFEAWEYKPEVRDYLLRFKRRGVFTVYQLIGHAYLHIAYDLPRVIADSHTNTYGTPLTDPLGMDIPQAIPMDRARLIYLGPGPNFLALMQETSGWPSVTGIFALLKIVPFRKSLMGTFGYWIVALRTVAWIHADSLRESGNRATLEQSLLASVKQAADEVDQQRRNPFAWLVRLFPPNFFLAVPLMIQATFEQSRTARTGAIVGLAALIIVSYFIYTYTWLTDYADRLGKQVYKNTVKAMSRFQEQSNLNHEL